MKKKGLDAVKILTFTAMAVCMALQVRCEPANTGLEFAEALEEICSAIDDCEPDDSHVKATPDILAAKYGVTTNDILQGLKDIVVRNGGVQTNFYGKLPRRAAVAWIGSYGGTNDLPFLVNIMTNVNDYACDEAIGAGLAILKHSPLLIPFAENIMTNDTVFSKHQKTRIAVRLLLLGRSMDDNAQKERIAAFFLERARLPSETPLSIDRCACELNPWYRHSQQRRDNLAALRPPGLTGKPAELYDAAQRDATQED